mgnify:CR=1 FL=1
MEAAFLGAAAAPERQVRPDSLELNRARAVFTPSPAIRGRADFPGVDSGKFLRAAAAASHSESSGPGYGATMRARTQPARLASPPHLYRTPLPTPSRARSSLLRAQTFRASMIWRLWRNDGLLDIHAHSAHCAHVRGGMRRSKGEPLHMHVTCFVRYLSRVREYDERGW